jgi:hypothetical protein
MLRRSGLHRGHWTSVDAERCSSTANLVRIRVSVDSTW